jgi:uncharacterized membrane protein
MRPFVATQIALAALVIVPFLPGSGTRGAEPSLRALDFIPTAVSADGSVVTGYRGAGGEQYSAVRWTSDRGATVLGEGRAWGISADGSTLVGEQRGHAVRWTSGRGIEVITPGWAEAVSADGSAVVVNYIEYSPDYGGDLGQAFRWTAAGGLVGLRFGPSFDSTTGRAISSDGSVIVGGAWSNFTGVGTKWSSQAFRWTADGDMVGLGIRRNDPSGWATAVSADGSVVVGNGFRWTSQDGAAQLPGWANGMSADGSLVVGGQFLSPANVYEAFIWDRANGTRSMRDVLDGMGVDVRGWKLGWAEDISADGLISVGGGTDPSGQFVGWIATLPEPERLPLLSLAGALITCRRRGRKRAAAGARRGWT